MEWRCGEDRQVEKKRGGEMLRRREAKSVGRSVKERSEKRRDAEKKRSEEWREKCKREKREEKRC